MPIRIHPSLYSFALLTLACLPLRAAETFELLAKAPPDEFVVSGSPTYTPYGRQPPGAAGFAKVNHDCLWSMTAVGGRIWCGDVANVLCMHAVVRAGNPILEMDDHLYRVCNFGDSTYPGVPKWLSPAARDYVGDWRPPDIWLYDIATRRMQRRTPADPRIFLTKGFRAAGSTEEIVLLAGPHLYQAAINFFAFAAQDGTYLGSTTLTAYSNIRRFARVGADLYFGVANSPDQTPGGSVLRWHGTRKEPFRFDVVGRMDASAAYITAHQGRLFVTTWPKEESGEGTTEPILAGLWMSPLVPKSGLQPTHAFRWRKVWSVDAYEPDALVAITYGGGAMCSYGGDLYWGTMQLPGQGYESFIARYGTQVAPPDHVITNTARGTCIFRGRHFGEGPRRPPQIELLYGDASLPVYQPGSGAQSGTWQPQPNRFGPARFGRAGFGSYYNCYLWSMEVNDGKLYFGTYDYAAYLLGDALILRQPVPADLGGDLYCMDNPSTPARAVTVDGAGNPFNIGVRNLLSVRNRLYIGTLNLSNLRDLPAPAERGGGWEFLRLK